MFFWSVKYCNTHMLYSRLMDIVFISINFSPNIFTHTHTQMYLLWFIYKHSVSRCSCITMNIYIYIYCGCCFWSNYLRVWEDRDGFIRRWAAGYSGAVSRPAISQPAQPLFSIYLHISLIGKLTHTHIQTHIVVCLFGYVVFVLAVGMFQCLVCLYSRIYSPLQR